MLGAIGSVFARTANSQISSSDYRNIDLFLAIAGHEGMAEGFTICLLVVDDIARANSLLTQTRDDVNYRRQLRWRTTECMKVAYISRLLTNLYNQTIIRCYCVRFVRTTPWPDSAIERSISLFNVYDRALRAAGVRPGSNVTIHVIEHEQSEAEYLAKYVFGRMKQINVAVNKIYFNESDIAQFANFMAGVTRSGSKSYSPTIESQARAETIEAVRKYTNTQDLSNIPRRPGNPISSVTINI